MMNKINAPEKMCLNCRYCVPVKSRHQCTLKECGISDERIDRGCTAHKFNEETETFIDNQIFKVLV